MLKAKYTYNTVQQAIDAGHALMGWNNRPYGWDTFEFDGGTVHLSPRVNVRDVHEVHTTAYLTDVLSMSGVHTSHLTYGFENTAWDTLHTCPASRRATEQRRFLRSALKRLPKGWSLTVTTFGAYRGKTHAWEVWKDGQHVRVAQRD